MVHTPNPGPTPLSPATRARYDKPQPYRGVIARFPRAILDIARVSKYGAIKHQVSMGDMSYLDVPDAHVNFVEAEVRHLLHEAIHGPTNNEDDGLIHKAQKAWEALADLEVYLYEEERALNNLALRESRAFEVDNDYDSGHFRTHGYGPASPNSNPLDD